MGTKVQILVVDDSLTVRMELRAMISTAGFAVTACETLAAAHRAMRVQTFSAFILDVELPDGSGIDLLRQIRDNPKLHTTPVILLSTRSEVARRVEGLSKGADEYIGKPVDRTYLVARLWQALGMSEKSSAQSTGGTGKKVLVVDDSETFLQVAAEQLRRDGHDVVLARSGEEALQLLAVEPVDCVLIDYIMPDLNGTEVCQRLRRLPGREGVPVMLMTANDNPVVRVHALAAGADSLVVKSPEADQIRMELRTLLRRQRVEPPRAPAQAAADAPPPSSRSGGGSLLGQVVAVSGLSTVIARGAIERACRRVGVDAMTMTAPELQRALPAIQEALRTFLSEEEADQRVRSMTALARLACRTGR